MSRLRWVLLALVLAVAGLTAYHHDRNPERRALTASVREHNGAPGAFATLGDGVTYYEAAGRQNGRVAVLVHGFSVPSYIWDPTFAALRDAGYRVIRYDLFGRGLSDRPDAAYDGAFYDRQLDDLLKALKVEGKIDLFGLSFGGYVSAHYASTHPQRIRTLNLVDPSNSAPVIPWQLATPLLGPYLFQTQYVPTMADNQSSDFLHPEQFPGWAERYRPQMAFYGFGRALYRSRLSLSRENFDAIYAAIARNGTPVHLLWGKQDPVIPVTQAAHIRNAIPSTTYTEIDQSGHLPQMEQTALFNQRILAYLEDHP
ncbi:Pimeloyl-ACP methyl ester carboxylesterase [Duganella sp. CF402]|uniref:alpha/beta fold hydrolase n=1 Tax=unclassified Duganella TaxID=2636909 RepID=UPI0008C02144|nr:MULTISPECIES: alpha/beta hydrolase [unclassified Duganella]RZT08890.1 pimeloyl-ACP methyl ester carboxylesterase [Duganella sp. BK701]SEL77882.1 Pimeloyl-ACP methyl ester carboxylesterase [Duganella sp. CF402]